jgi:hypothetical protein
VAGPLFILITRVVGLVPDSVETVPGILLIAVGAVGEVTLVRAQKREGAHTVA